MQDYWSFQISMPELPDVKKKLMEADMNLFKADLDVKVWEILQSMKNDRSILMRIAQMNKYTSTSIDAIRTNLESLVTFDMKLIMHGIDHKEGKTILTISVLLHYFKLWDAVKKSSKILSLIPANLTSKEGIMKHFEKEMAKTYSKEYELKVLE